MEPSPPTQYSLIGKLADPRDAEAWSEFATIYQPIIFRICQRKGLQHADATDVTQEVLAQVAKSIDKFDPSHPGATFRGWLYRVTRNSVVDFFRNKNRKPILSAGTDVFANVQHPDAGSKEFFLEYQRQIFLTVSREVAAKVNPSTWKAFWETEMERRSAEEVAGELGITVGALYVARSRVLARLKKAAAARMEETGIGAQS